LVEVAAGPEFVSPELVLEEVAVSFSYHSAAKAFEGLDSVCDADFSCSLEEKVDVVWSEFDCADCYSEFLRAFEEVGECQLAHDLVAEDVPSVGGCELEVPVGFSDAVSGRLVGLVHFCAPEHRGGACLINLKAPSARIRSFVM